MANIKKPVMLNETGLMIVGELEDIARAISGSSTHKIYGVKRSLTSTLTAWERTDDGIGKVANATKDGSSVTNDFDSIYPWSAIKTVNYDVENDTVVAEIGDANFAFDGSNGEVMTYIPHFYIERTNDGETKTIRISEYKFGNAIEIPSFYIARYTTSDGTHSYSGVDSSVSKNIATFRTEATEKGEGWHLLDWHYYLLQHLYLVEYADANSQSKLGNGVSSVSTKVVSGQCDSLGMHSGCLANAGATSVIYRGVENPFSNIWQLLDGHTVKDHNLYVCMNYEKYANESVDGYELIGTLASANGNPTTMCYNADMQLVGMPATIGTSTYADCYWQASGTRLVLVGGAWDNGSNAGFFCFDALNAFSLSAGRVGSRLIKSV